MDSFIAPNLPGNIQGGQGSHPLGIQIYSYTALVPKSGFAEVR